MAKEIDDGGFIYPHKRKICSDLRDKESAIGNMLPEHEEFSGISRRDWLAGQYGAQIYLARVMACSLIATNDNKPEPNTLIGNKSIAEEAYEQADAMIAASKKE